MNQMISPDIKVCKIAKQQNSSEKIVIKPFPMLDQESPPKK
jgi:hypothetical protein